MEKHGLRQQGKNKASDILKIIIIIIQLCVQCSQCLSQVFSGCAGAIYFQCSIASSGEWE